MFPVTVTVTVSSTVTSHGHDMAAARRRRGRLPGPGQDSDPQAAPAGRLRLSKSVFAIARRRWDRSLDPITMSHIGPGKQCRGRLAAAPALLGPRGPGPAITA